MNNNERTFQELWKGVAADLNQANDHFQLWLALRDLFLLEKGNLPSQEFWTLTLRAHRDMAIVLLRKVYDRSGKSEVKLVKLLGRIKKDIKEKIKPSPSQKQLYANQLAQLKIDMEETGDKDPLVAKFICLTNATVHRRDYSEEFLISEIEELITRGKKIIDRYYHLIEGQHICRQTTDILKEVRQDLRISADLKKLYYEEVVPAINQNQNICGKELSQKLHSILYNPPLELGFALERSTQPTATVTAD